MKIKYHFVHAFGALLLLFIFTGTLVAQDCKSGFYPSTVGTIMEQTHSDKKGKVVSVATSKITSVEPTTAGYKIAMQVSGKDDKGKESFNTTSSVTCENGVYHFQFNDLFSSMMSSTAAMKNMEMVISGDDMAMPSNLTVGQALPDATSVMEMKMNGTSLMSFTFAVKNRKVAAKESITTAAGTFECYKITNDMDVKMMGNRTLKVSSWWALGAGLIRQESYNATGELESKMELTKFIRP